MINIGIRKALFGLTVWTLALGGAVAALLGAAPAEAQQSKYTGTDARYANIKMDLTLTRLPAGNYDATGLIYLGSTFRYTVKGNLAGGALTAGLIYSSGLTVTSIGVAGTLTGAVGTGPIMVTTGPVPTGSGAFNALSFGLLPVAMVVPPPPPPFPANVSGSTGFGYTKVDMALHFARSGNVYNVSGQMTVRSIRPQVVTTVMQISGVYNPNSVPARFLITGAPAAPNNKPVLTGTFLGQSLNCQVSGIPTLGINSLYIVAK